MSLYIGADIGGSTARITGFRTLNPHVDSHTLDFTMSKADAETGLPADFGADFENLVDRIHRIVSLSGESPQAIALGIAGRGDKHRSRIVMAGNLSHWVGQDFVERLKLRFGCPVVLGNDAEVAALAEAVYGHASTGPYKGQDFLEKIWGTGVGGAAVRFTPGGGYLPIPGEPGHLLVGPPHSVQCGCGQSGCVESYAGGDRLVQRYGMPASRLSPAHWIEAATWVIKGLQGYLRVQPVDVVYFSGGVACKQEWLLPIIEQALDAPEFGSPKVRLSAFREGAGTIGALSLLSL